MNSQRRVPRYSRTLDRRLTFGTPRVVPSIMMTTTTQTTTPTTIKIYAPFYVHGVWTWHLFTTRDPNLRSACADKANELGARTWDVTQASMMINGTVVDGHPTVFA